MNILEQTRTVLVVRFGDALLPVFAAAACTIAGLGILVAGSTMGNLVVALLGVALIILGGLLALGERHVTLTIDRQTRTLLVRRWKNLMPGQVLYRLSDIASFDVACGPQQTRLSALTGKPPVRCTLIANFPSGPDMALVRNLSQGEASELHRLIMMYLE